VNRCRNAIIEKPGDIDCVSVVAAVLDGMKDIELPQRALEAAEKALVWQGNGLAGIYEPEFHATISSLAEELRGAR
jgi:hypothetical protein